MRHLAIFLAVLCACGAVTAQTIVPKLDEPGRKGEVARNAREKAKTQFEAMDEDKNDKLSREEVAKHFRYLAENFDKHDADKDGFLNWEEYVGHNRWSR
jgi:hypothetical protein